ncbi:MAG: hypothetical protein EPO07_15500 [Verrucomicrobia bacterium]|nr:MAG: hypothetical protein EPO07_15500 [Verrucomicrobiota bacterium]
MKALELIARVVMGCVFALRQNFNHNPATDVWKFRAKRMRHTLGLTSRVRVCAGIRLSRSWPRNCKANSAEGNTMKALQGSAAGCLCLVMLAMVCLILQPETVASQSVAYFSAQHTNQPPLPFNPFPELNTVCLSNNIFVVQDQSVDYGALEETRQLMSEMTIGLFGFDSEESNGPEELNYGPDDLWIELISVTNNYAYLTLHNTKPNVYYQLLSKTNLNETLWHYGQIMSSPSGTNQIYFDPVLISGVPNQFFRGVSGTQIINVFPNLNAKEPSSTNSSDGIVGSLYVLNGSFSASAVRVYYLIGGTAENGIDYTQILDHVDVPAGSQPTSFIWISPRADQPFEPAETVSLTLVVTNGYLVNSLHSSAEIQIEDNPGIRFTVVTNLHNPVGIDYSPTTNSLILSMNYSSGNPFNFLRVATNETGQLTTNAWSGIQGIANEVKIAIVKTNVGGFTNGDMFFGSGAHVGWLSADGSSSNLNWATLTNATFGSASVLRGGLYLDETGVFSNQLIAVTSDDQYFTSAKGIWRVDFQGHPTFITNIVTPHLEGAITIPNDTSSWGPWAGKLLTGDESQHKIYAIDADGLVTTYQTTNWVAAGIDAEDFDFIPANQDLYVCDLTSSQLLKVSQSYFTNYVGDLLITHSGDSLFTGSAGALFIVHWDSTNSVFTARRIPKDNDEFEHATFAPCSLPSH